MASDAGATPPATPGIVLSPQPARQLQQARKSEAATARVSLDLGRSLVDVQLTLTGVVCGTEQLPWDIVDQIAADDHGCYEVIAGTYQRLQCMSTLSGRLATLYATAGPPALLLSGTLMHRIKDIHPGQDTELKLAPLGRLTNCQLLDTVTGLGYTGIEARRRGATSVQTVEIDPAVIDLQQRNPWSRPLLEDEGIVCHQGDITEIIDTFEPASFDRILHDPPVLELSGDLYGGAFYRQLFRVLARRGRLFHYIGNLDSPSGRRVLPGVIRRLQEAGFVDVRRIASAFGVSASV